MRWSIRTKIMLLVSAMLLFAILAYLVVAERVFREDKELLVFDTNRSSTEQLASEIESSLRRLVDKLEMIAQLAADATPASLHLAYEFLENDPELLVLRITQVASAGPGRPPARALREIFSKHQLRSLGLAPEQVIQAGLMEPLAESRARAPGVASPIRIENRSWKGHVLYFLEVPIKGSPHLRVLALIEGGPMLQRMQNRKNLAFSFAVSSSGVVLGHPHASEVVERRSLAQLEPVREALAQPFPLRQMEFEDQGKRYLGVYQKTALGGAVVVSMTDKQSALSARGLLLERTLYVSLVIVTVVFIVSLFFSASLSDPLLRLARITQEVAGGKFDVRIPVDTGDEIGTLARSFGDMAHRLRDSHLLLEHANQDLELKVQERTRELESRNVDIRKQQEALLRATRLAAVGEIAGQAAHEVLNPLTAMTSRLESLDLKIREFTEEPTAPIPSLKTILDAWQKDYDQGGFEGWLRAMREPSRVIPGKALFDEDLYNLAIIWAQLFHHNQTLREDFTLLLSESHRIARIVDGMRGLSRTRQIRARADITELVSESVRVSEDLLKRHHIAIETEFDERPLFAILDRDEMRQVFSNLIKNSMDAIEGAREHRRSGPAREGLVRIHVQRRQDLIRIALRDNGQGIPEADRNRVFDADFSTKGAEGTGFGLSICRRFVRQAGGELIVSDSRPGEFTEFEITLPLSTEPS